MECRRLTRAGVVRLAWAVGLGSALLALSACNKVQAKTPGPAPAPLAIPEPPPRMIVSVDITPPPPPPPATDKPAAAATSSTSRPPRSTATPTPTPTPPPASSTEAPPPVVQTSDQAQNEARAKEHLKNAENNLSKVQSASLPAAAKDQFDNAQKFVRMAQEALKARNFVYALSCAEKAATLAALLVKN